MALVLAVLAVGIWLRVRDFPSVVLWGDELHALRAVDGLSLSEAFVHYQKGNSGIPLNLWTWLLMRGGVLDELTLRLPMVLAGLALLALPLLLVRRLGRGTTLILAGLVASSPVLVYFSFVARPYALVLLALTGAFVAWDRWCRGGSRSAWLTFAVACGLAVFFHVFAAFTVAALYLAALTGLRDGRTRWRELLLGGAVTAAVVALLLGPGLSNMLSVRARMVGGDRANLDYVPEVFEILTGFLGGTSGLVLVAAFVGIGSWWRRDALFATAGAAVVVAQVLGLMALRPDAGVVAYSRWALLPWPIVLVFVASGLSTMVDRLGPALPRRGVLVGLASGAVGIVALHRIGVGDEVSADGILAGLRWVTAPLHSWGALLVLAAAAVRAAPLRASTPTTAERGPTTPNWLRSREVTLSLFGAALAFAVVTLSPVRLLARDVDTLRTHRSVQRPELDDRAAPPPYARLAEAAGVGDVLLECPPPIPMAGWTPHIVFQRVHGKRIRFVTPRDLPADDPTRGMRNVLVLDDVEALLTSGARYLVLHLDAPSEYRRYQREDLLDERNAPLSLALAARARRTLSERCGPPAFASRTIEVYDLTRWGRGDRGAAPDDVAHRGRDAGAPADD